MSTGTVQEQAAQVLELMTSDALQMSFGIDDGGDAIVPGQPVALNADGTIRAANAAIDFPIGTAVKGEADGERAIVRINSNLVMNFAASGGDLVAGNYARQAAAPNANGYPSFAVAASTEIAQAIVLKGATSGNIGLLAIITPFVVA